jgi:AcrR family transcriptional regulator
MNKSESKYFNTAVRMDEALITLLERKDFEYITVKEICETAGVNRSTFYLHYENTSDLLRETARYIIDKHFAYYGVEGAGIAFQPSSCRREELLFITEEYLTPYLTFIKENQRLFKVTIKQFHSMNMDEMYVRMFERIFSPILSRFCVPASEHAYVMKFYLSGVFAVVMEWLSKDCADDMKTVIKVITDCVMGERNPHGQVG